MRRRDIASLAFRSVWRGGVKSALCVLAFCVGICSTCTVITLGGTASIAVSGEIDRIGVGGTVFYSSEDFSVSNETLSLVRGVEGVHAAMPLSIELGTAWLKGKGGQAMVCGVGSDLAEIFNVSLLHGRLFDAHDIQSGARVAVIDDELARASYFRSNVVGKMLTLSLGSYSEEFEIIGVIRSQKQGVEGLLGGQIPTPVYAPHTAIRALGGKLGVDKIAVSISGIYSEQAVTQAVTKRLESATGLTFRNENLNQYADSLKNITGTVSLFAAGVAGISIVVGGMGVMNAMISAVDSRTRDVGVYLALGARRRDILACFLMEAQLLCMIGAAMGVAVSAVIFRAVSLALGLPAHLDWGLIALILPCAAACGTVFGLIPALRAARMNPIDAIRAT